MDKSRRIEEVKALRSLGWSKGAIARKLRVGKATVIRDCLAYGEPAGARSNRVDYPVEEIVARYEAGASLEEIARDYDCYHVQIGRVLTRAGYPPAKRRGERRVKTSG